jgi:hypothetical protein
MMMMMAEVEACKNDRWAVALRPRLDVELFK